MGGGNREELTRDEVTPLRASFRNTDTVEVAAEGSGKSDGFVVLLVADYEGWGIKVDGESRRLRHVNGNIGADLRPGKHRYVFSFRPGMLFPLGSRSLWWACS